MDDFLTDQQQAARVRGWVREYAPAAIGALVVGLGGYFSYSQWQGYQENQAAEASDLFEEFREALDANSPDAAGELHQRLLTDFEGSGYADHARLLMAREYVDTTQPSLAAEELKSLIETTDDGDLRQLARLRLARVFLYMDRAEEGLDVLVADAYSAAWKQMSEDMRGDLLRALGRTEEARAAYQAALDQTGQVDAGWIRLKLNHLGAVEAAREDEVELETEQELQSGETDEAVQPAGEADAAAGEASDLEQE